jgi:hypothetical protein
MISNDTKALARDLAARCLALPVDNNDRSLLAFETHGKPNTVFDTGIYTKNRAMRMAYSSKAGKDSPLLPILGSSSDVAAHLINVPPRDVFTPPQLLPTLHRE